MKSNDTLLCHLVATHEMVEGSTPKLKIDDIIHKPSVIDVAANEVVFLHFFHSKTNDFEIEITTPTCVITLTPNNTSNNSCNTIIKSLGNIVFKNSLDSGFYVQLLRILY